MVEKSIHRKLDFHIVDERVVLLSTIVRTIIRMVGDHEKIYSLRSLPCAL